MYFSGNTVNFLCMIHDSGTPIVAHKKQFSFYVCQLNSTGFNVCQDKSIRTQAFGVSVTLFFLYFSMRCNTKDSTFRGNQDILRIKELTDHGRNQRDAPDGITFLGTSRSRASHRKVSMDCYCRSSSINACTSSLSH